MYAEQDSYSTPQTLKLCVVSEELYKNYFCNECERLLQQCQQVTAAATDTNVNLFVLGIKTESLDARLNSDARWSFPEE